MGYKKVTIADIAKDLNLSTSTVSRAISGKGRVSKETVQRVMDYVEKFNYNLDITTKMGRDSRSNNILFLLPMEQNAIDMPFFHNCLLGATSIAEQYFYDILVLEQQKDNITSIQRVVRNNKIKGVILSTALKNDKAIEYLRELNFPFVLIGNYNDENITSIDYKHESACFKITLELLNKKNGNIGLIGGSITNPVNEKRLKGFERAVKEKNREGYKVYSYLDVKNDKYVDVVVEECLSKNIDYIFCMDDYICLNVLNKLKNMDRYLYEHMELVSLQSNEYLDDNYPYMPRLKFDIKVLGGVACLELIKKLDSEATITHKLLEYEIIL